MAKPPESNWRITHGEQEGTTPSADSWDRPAYDMEDDGLSGHMARAPAFSALRWLLIIVALVLVGVGIRLITTWL